MNPTPRFPPRPDPEQCSRVPVERETGPSTSAISVEVGHKKPRNRVRFSCTTCREKKLKCNRAMPCDQCTKRNIAAACYYQSHAYPRDGHRGNAASMRSVRSPQMDWSSQERLRYLERTVAFLRNKLVENGVAAEEGKTPGTRRDISRDSDIPQTPLDLSGVFVEPSPAGALVGDMRFVDAANWEAILDDVTNLTKELKTHDEDGEDEGELAGDTSPILLSGSWPQMTVSEMVFEYLPMRPVTDQLIDRFFKGKEPAWLMFHKPYFYQQYYQFWRQPHEASLSFVGLLFIIIAHAALFCLRGDEEVPGHLGPAMSVCDLFRIRAAHALALDDITKPGKWKVEAMILYFGIEYLRLSDAQRGTSILMTMTVRLAMHMGLHRDPLHYKELSIFECEMRRRLWTLLVEIDLLVAFQFGLPANVQRQFFDTKLPRNILDEDFNEATTEWPPERPQTERTPALYTIVKSRVVVVFGDILSTVTSRDSPTYGEVRRLDKKLQEAHEAIPPILKVARFDLSKDVPVDVIMQRLWIELMYQKARIVLHRRYFTVARRDSRYEYSHQACLHASEKILEYQFEIHNEMMHGGRLSKERWFLSSLSTHDFLLANMMLALEMSHLLPRNSEDGVDRHGPARERLLGLLSTSRNIWQARCEESIEAMRAFKVLSRMLTIATGMPYEMAPQAAAVEAVVPSQMPSYQYSYGMNLPNIAEEQLRQAYGDESQSHMVWPVGAQAAGVPGGLPAGQWQNNPPSFAAPMPMQEPMVDMVGHGLDWASFDTQILNATDDTMEIPWTNFFPAGQGPGY